MSVIDSHQHFWQFNPVRDAWIQNEMAVLRRNFMPEELSGIYSAAGITGCVAVQADQSEDETLFLADLASKHTFIKGVVGWTDLCSERISEKLNEYQELSIVKGFRHIVQAENATEFLRREDFCRGIRELERQGFTYDLLIYARQLPAAREFVARFPNLLFVVGHAAKPDIKSIRAGARPPYASNEAFAWWKQEISRLAAHPNVYCKISGLVTEADWTNWSTEDIIPFIDVLLSVFGAKRLMFGSDWPVCLLAAAEYDQVWLPVKQYLSALSVKEQAQIYHRTATEFYRLTL